MILNHCLCRKLFPTKLCIFQERLCCHDCPGAQTLKELLQLFQIQSLCLYQLVQSHHSLGSLESASMMGILFAPHLYGHKRFEICLIGMTDKRHSDKWYLPNHWGLLDLQDRNKLIPLGCFLCCTSLTYWLMRLGLYVASTWWGFRPDWLIDSSIPIVSIFLFCFSQTITATIFVPLFKLSLLT